MPPIMGRTVVIPKICREREVIINSHVKIHRKTAESL